MQAVCPRAARDGDPIALPSPAPPSIRLLFIIRSMGAGGAERQFTELVRGLDKRRFAVTVATCYDGGALLPELREIDGVEVISLGKKGRWETVSFLHRLARVARAVRPHIVVGNHGLPNILSLIAGRAVGARVVWSIRAAYMDFSRYDRLSAWLFRADAWLSRWPDMIIANSHAGRRYRISAGYCGQRMVVIQNGIDIGRFQPDRQARRRMRDQWGLTDEQPLIGLTARLDPMKDHPTFLRAASTLLRERDDVRFVCVGDGPDPYRAELHGEAHALGLDNRLLWAGEQREMRAVYNAFDIATLSSYGEGLPNAIAEAMACGVPCAATDVGDTADLIGESGIVVPPRDPAALAQGWRKLLSMPPRERAALADAARERIVRRFSAPQLASRTESALVSLL